MDMVHQTLSVLFGGDLGVAFSADYFFFLLSWAMIGGGSVGGIIWFVINKKHGWAVLLVDWITVVYVTVSALALPFISMSTGFDLGFDVGLHSPQSALVIWPAFIVATWLGWTSLEWWEQKMLSRQQSSLVLV